MNSLAFKVFCSTQYVRHHDRPLFSPEPDVLHEILGHIPMLYNQDFADMCQHFGLATLGCTEEELTRLGALFWHTVEIGVCKEAGGNRVYGTAILTSINELDHTQSGIPKYLDFDVDEIALHHTEINDKTVQPYYFLAPSFGEVTGLLTDYIKTKTSRPFTTSFDQDKNEIVIDRKIKTRANKAAILY